jgi:hypothetical protein
MAVNVSKTKYIIFRNKGQVLNLGENKGIFYNDNNHDDLLNPNNIVMLDRISNENATQEDKSYKLLGVYLDEFLSFDAHIDNVRKKISQSNFIINRSKNFLPKKLLITLYYSLIHPHLIYCLPVYGCTSQKNINKISKLQRKSIRIINKVKYNCNTDNLFVDNGILPFEKLVKYSQSIIVHSIYHKYSPQTLHNEWITNAERNIAYEMRNAEDYYIPRPKNESLKKLSYFTLPLVWNNLEPDKYHINPNQFKKYLKHHLLSIE